MGNQRKNLRLSSYDYTQEGLYFVTICTQHKQCRLGTITNSIPDLSAEGKVLHQAIQLYETKYPHVQIIQYVIMPNHVHLLFHITQAMQRSPLRNIVNALKSHVTRTLGYSLWQRGYYDHIIRNERDLKYCQEYIQNNPLKWELDKEYV